MKWYIIKEVRTNAGRQEEMKNEENWREMKRCRRYEEFQDSTKMSMDLLG